MSLKKKLVLAFIIMILFPCILMGIVASVAFQSGLHKYSDAYGIKGDPMQLIREPINTLVNLTADEYNELCTTTRLYPSRIENAEWRDSLNQSLLGNCSYLVVVKGSEDIFVGDEEHYSLNKAAIASSIEKTSEPNGGAVLSFGDRTSIVKHNNFTYSDGEHGEFLIVTKVNPIFTEVRKNVISGIMTSLLLIAVVAFLLALWVYRSVFKPIKALRQASREISQGNLNFKLERREKDEIGGLCNDFEEMRHHLKTQIDQREKYEQDVRDMISNVSHDLKTPLTAIKGYAEGMLDGVADTEEKRNRYLKTIVVRATDMTLLVDELSYYSKLDNNKLPYNFEKVNAMGYFGDCVEESAMELELKDFSVYMVSEISADQEVIMDCEQIRRVMNNLIGNAVKYRNEEIHGDICVKLTDADNSVRISVIDNGIGISKEALPHIFDKFYRADKSRTSGRAGTGIGLAIVKKIVTEHGGRVFAKSELGKGTTISFTVKKGE